MYGKAVASKILCFSLLTVSVVSSFPSTSFAAHTRGFLSSTKDKSQLVADRGDERYLKNLEQVYTVLEKVIRANALDDHPWRMQVIDQYSINAFATDTNLVAIYTGILDQLDGDEAAIAFILGHEIAHHKHRHIAASAAEDSALQKRLHQEAEQEIDAEVKKLEGRVKQFRRALIAAELACRGGGFFRIKIGCRALPIPQALVLLFNADGKLDENKVKSRKQEIIARKQAEYSAKSQELSHAQELESDQYGLTYMTRAGFDPAGSLRAMEILTRQPVPDPEKSSHPDAGHRLELLKKQIANQSRNSLLTEGSANLKRNPKPLGFSLSQDGKSLRVNSRFSSGN